MKTAILGVLALSALAAGLVTAGRPATAASVSGVVEGSVFFDTAGNRVRAQANLTPNIGGYGYIGWLVNERTDAKVNTGPFSDGINNFGTNALGSGFTAYVITFEPLSNTSNTPAGLPVAKAALSLNSTVKLASTISGSVDVSDTSVGAQTAGLPKLPAGFEYVGWLVNEISGQKLNVGVLGSDGANRFQGTGLSSRGFTAYVVTYEPTGNRTNDPQGMPVAKGAISFPAAPAALPRTGDGGYLSGNRLGPSTLVMVATGAAALAFGVFGVALRTKARRHR